MCGEAFGWDSCYNLATNFLAKLRKEVMEYRDKFMNQVNVKPQRVVLKVLYRIWSSSVCKAIRVLKFRT